VTDVSVDVKFKFAKTAGIVRAKTARSRRCFPTLDTLRRLSASDPLNKLNRGRANWRMVHCYMLHVALLHIVRCMTVVRSRFTDALQLTRTRGNARGCVLAVLAPTRSPADGVPKPEFLGSLNFYRPWARLSAMVVSTTTFHEAAVAALFQISATYVTSCITFLFLLFLFTYIYRPTWTCPSTVATWGRRVASRTPDRTSARLKSKWSSRT
jgi:hypothetical protein